MSNRNVIEEIRAALDRDPRIAHAAEIAVGEREGMVTLRGTVSSPRQRRTAVEIARSVPGVRSVNDGLRIDPRDHSPDDEIRGAALQALLSDERVPDRVDVSVANGWLTLKGEVKRQRESDAAFDAVSRVAGVGGITNRIVVVSPGVDG
jgi:osmotically-inducible protein OsmY